MKDEKRGQATPQKNPEFARSRRRFLKTAGGTASVATVLGVGMMPTVRAEGGSLRCCPSGILQSGGDATIDITGQKALLLLLLQSDLRTDLNDPDIALGAGESWEGPTVNWTTPGTLPDSIVIQYTASATAGTTRTFNHCSVVPDSGQLDPSGSDDHSLTMAGTATYTKRSAEGANLGTVAGDFTMTVDVSLSLASDGEETESGSWECPVMPPELERQCVATGTVTRPVNLVAHADDATVAKFAVTGAGGTGNVPESVKDLDATADFGTLQVTVQRVMDCIVV